ncbi:MAG: 2-C-methyl-D-erythritol 2,4-cyclodiphosphate synthase [Phycisphaerales bacterium]|nr:MAG: 2-C-methyl-D-erythritol 2,4-cyclodiphosphate synthase [Phycisphaerales bacterium]
MTDAPPIRIGHGYDLHRLEPLDAPPAPSAAGKPSSDAQPVRPLILGGVRLEHDRGPIGHSDGDALYHAVTDALLGAIAEPDIGQLFPDTDPRHDGAESRVFVAEALRRVRAAGYAVGNLDATVILERPKLGAHKAAMRVNLAELLGVDISRVNVKGKTHERVDAVGEGRAVEVHAVVVLQRE